MPEPWEDATARKTLRQADLYQPGSSPDSHAGALLGQPLPLLPLKTHRTKCFHSVAHG